MDSHSVWEHTTNFLEAAYEVLKITGGPLHYSVRAGNDDAKTAVLHGPEGRMTYNGQEYKSVSLAGKAASGWKSCNGWTYWRYEEPTTHQWLAIEHLRPKT